MIHILNKNLTNKNRNDMKDIVLTFDENTIYGSCEAKKCPICKKLTDLKGDLNSPFVNVSGEKFCKKCIKKLRKLLLITENK
jgi:hypothetical protein